MTRQTTAGVGLAIWLVACATTIVDYQVPLEFSVRVRTSNGGLAAGTEVVLADGLSERPLGITDAKGELVVTHAILWGHKKGAKASTPQFKVMLRHPDCTPMSLTRGATSPRDADGFYPVEIRETLQCKTVSKPPANEPQ